MISKLIRVLQQISLMRWHEIVTFALVSFFAQPTKASLISGGIISLVGFSIRIAADGFRFRAQPFEVVGPYRFVRHPYYLGTFFLLMGFCVASRSTLATVLALCGMLIIFRLIFQEEESLLSKQGGERYKEYRLAVSSFIPNLIPFRRIPQEGQRFSLMYALFRKDRRELDTLIALVVGYACLYGFMKWLPSAKVQGGIAFLLVLTLCIRTLLANRRSRSELRTLFVGE